VGLLDGMSEDNDNNNNNIYLQHCITPQYYTFRKTANQNFSNDSIESIFNQAG